MPRKRCWPAVWTLVLLLAGLVPLASDAADHVLTRELFVDPTRSISIDDIAEQAFEPAPRVLTGGFSDAAFWLRLSVAPPIDGGELVLRVRPSVLDTVELYAPDASHPGAWSRRVSGDRHPFEARELGGFSLGFLLAPSTDVVTIYLRMETTSSSLMLVDALTPKQAQTSESLRHMLVSASIGLILCLIIWALSDYVTRRSRVLAWFIAVEAAFVVFVLLTLGYLAPLFPGESAAIGDRLTSLSVILMISMGWALNRAMLEVFSTSRLAHRAITALGIFPPLLLLLFALGEVRLALMIAHLLAALQMPLMLAPVLAPRRDAILDPRLIRAAYLLIIGLGISLTLLPLLGWVEAAELTLYGHVVRGLVGGCVLFTILHLRARQLIRQGHRTELELAVARTQAELDREQRQDKERFLAMLTHELKTPMAVVRMTLAAASLPTRTLEHAETAIRDMDAIVERCLQVDRNEQSAAVANPSRFKLQELFDELRDAGRLPARVAISLDPGIELNTDRQFLLVAVANLIDNALRYSPPDSAVNLMAACHPRDGRRGILVSVENQPGSAGRPDPARVFERYYRSPQAQRLSGTGLGLYLVREMSALLGGTVSYVTPSPSVKFEIWLPQ